MKLRISIFTNAGTVPLEVAASRGYFREEGLEVEIVSTTSSIAQMTGLIDGAFEIAASAIDNVIAYREGQGAAPTNREPDLVVFMGSASYRLPFVVAPRVAGFADLEGKTIAVDALSTGFAFLLREMLAINGLDPDRYEFRSFGAPRERWRALREGVVDGALLNDHFATIAKGLGFRALASDPDPWDDYQGNVFCARTDWVAANRSAVEGFVRATLAGVNAVLDPDNTQETAEALVAHLGGGLEMTEALRIARALQAPGSIVRPGLPITMSGISQVMRLREKYTGYRIARTPEDYLDRSLIPELH
ncbi:ABC transporter substrate-binding protein [Pararhizobium mangrovi]|uniref:ABC transporter substrate-binding protein n=1 Tax=Pararhizobium mangrovi TaxID=2590452 RepID=A0A506U8E7_9HYPH|nr:ABC transporter substrate-binding protein [Pararhizobium mangrovi]TPW30623.1 ABC transporter substrate-binding protein [Pararhizobium mangrovi]